jgi:hypothetical protein
MRRGKPFREGIDFLFGSSATQDGMTEANELLSHGAAQAARGTSD